MPHATESRHAASWKGTELERPEDNLHDDSGGGPAPAAGPRQSSTEMRVKSSVALSEPRKETGQLTR